MKNFTVNRGNSKAKISSKINSSVKKSDNEIQLNIKNKDMLEIKDQSPLLYNRLKNSKIENINNNEIKLNPVKSSRARAELENISDDLNNVAKENSLKIQRDDENEILRKRIIELEKELTIAKTVTNL